MKKACLLLQLLFISSIIYAQDPCQEIVHSIASSSHTPTFEVDSITGETIIYYDLCIGEELTLNANAYFRSEERFSRNAETVQ